MLGLIHYCDQYMDMIASLINKILRRKTIKKKVRLWGKTVM